jgi:group I intron endonuclease
MRSFTPISTHAFAMDTDAPVFMCGVYVIEHEPTGRVYVGHVGGRAGRGFLKRCQEHFYNAVNAKAQHSRSRFGNFVRKHGTGGFLFHVVVVISPEEPNEVFARAEQGLIDGLDAAGPGGLNTHPHATTPRGVKRSEEVRQKQSESRLRHFAENPDALDALRKRLADKNRSEAVRSATRARNSDPEFQRRRMSGIRKLHADPQRSAAFRAKQAHLWDDKRRAQRSSISKALMADPQRRAAFSKPVMCVSTGVKYPSRAEAARAHGLAKQGLVSHLKGRAPSFAGHKWVEVSS